MRRQSRGHREKLMRARICSFVSVKVRLTFARDTSRRRAHFIFIGGNRISERHYQWCVFLLITRVIDFLSDIRADLLTARAARKSAAPCVVRGQARRPLKAQRASACASSDRIVNARKEPGFNAGGPSKPGSQIDSHERLQRQAPIPALSERKRRQMPIVSSQFCRNSGSRCWFWRDINGRPSWALDEAHYSGYSAFHCRSSFCCSGTPRR